MNFENFKSAINFRERIDLILFKEMNAYNPQIVINLSKEGYDLYIMKKNLVEETKELLNQCDDEKSFEDIIRSKIEMLDNAGKADASDGREPESVLNYKREFYMKILNVI